MFAQDGKQIFQTFTLPVSSIHRRRIPVSLRLDFESGRADIRIADDSATVSIAEAESKREFVPQLYFGTYRHIMETASFCLYGLRVECDGRRWDFPLDESHGNDVHDSRGVVVGQVQNPVWLINDAFHWKPLYRYYSLSPAGFAFSASRQQAFIYNRDSLIVYDLQRNESQGRSYDSPALPVRLGMCFYDDPDSCIYAYELNGWDTYVARIDPASCRWQMVDKGSVDLQLHHHGALFGRQSRRFLFFGGYGNRSYFNTFIRYDVGTNQWDTLTFDGDAVAPRFFAAMAMTPDGKHAYLYGGKGNEAGDQNVGIRYYYDLYRLDLEKHRIDKLWEHDAPAALFNPTALDCTQWMRVLKSAGIPAAILTAKHADGFCLWPSRYTDYCVKNAAWKNGKGDVVREFVDACEEYGIKAGIYLGPHDRHEHLHPDYSTERYKHYYAAQLTELMSQYGKIWETWWDGAGADELTTPLYTHWHEIVRRLQPDCVIFGTKNSYPFADVRWMGNERGEAGDPCWAITDSVAIRDEAAYYQALNEGVWDGDAYVPAETDVSIRPSWFYHAEEDVRVKSVKELWDIYCTSVGHNSVLLLNLPPDRRGLIHPADSLHVALLAQGLKETFGHNLLADSRVTANNERGGRFSAKNLVDNDKSTYYAGRDGHVKSDVVFRLPKAATFDCLMAEEVIELGHRTSRWSVEYSDDGRRWTPIAEATGKQSIGHKWIVRFAPVTARYVRLRIEDGRACPALHTFGVYRQSELFR